MFVTEFFKQTISTASW